MTVIMSSPPAKRVRLEDTTENLIPVDTTTDSAADLKARYPCLVDPVGAPRTNSATVGITEYVDASIPAFSAIIKHRFTDFLVYEVSKSGKVVELNDITRPPNEDVPNPEAEPKKPSLTADGQLVGLLSFDASKNFL